MFANRERAVARQIEARGSSDPIHVTAGPINSGAMFDDLFLNITTLGHKRDGNPEL